MRVYRRKLTATTATAGKKNMIKSAKCCSGGVGMSTTLGEGPGPGPRGWSMKAAIVGADDEELAKTGP